MRTLDVVYIYRHSPNDDFEIRYSMRSIDKYAPYIRKIWVYGDKPNFLSEDTSIVEHVPHELTSRVLGVKTPVRNFFLMHFLSSLTPGLAGEYLSFSDDYFLIKDFPYEEARKDRFLEDMANLERGVGLWKSALWHTYDTLLRLDYTGYNFETHVPAYMTRKRVMEAYCEFKDYITEDPWFGMTAKTAILNHAHKKENSKLVDMSKEKPRAGFWGKQPEYKEIEKVVQGKLFFNFDDDAFCPNIEKFLKKRFPKRCRYEKSE